MTTAAEMIARLGLKPHPEGGWTLVTCVVVPGFSFDGFELAPEGWSP